MAKKVISVILCFIIAVSAMTFSVAAAEVIEPDMPGEAFSFDDAYPASTGVSMDDPLIVPRIVVTTENGNGTVLQKDDGYVNAEISITDTDGSVLTDSCSFKVRGNTTAMTFIEKKAYTFKFEKKKNVLGLGSGKKWALLANAFDPTLLRNSMAFALADELGLSYTSNHRFVEVFVDGSYRGCYELTEPVQEGKDRVNIDIDSNDGKKDFLIEYEAQREEEGTTYFTFDGMRFISSEPEEPDDEQLAYIVDTMTGIINTLKTGARNEIEAAIDVPSFASYYLLNEYFKTMDFDMSSVFFYYQDGKLYAGPAWDYDMSTGNTNADLTSTRPKNTAKTDGIMQNNKNIYKYLCNKSWFMDEVKTVYTDHYDYIRNIFADGGQLDTWSAQNSELFERNATVWKVSKWLYNYQKKPLSTYQENLDFLKNWLSERNAWLTEYWELFPEEEEITVPRIVVTTENGNGLQLLKSDDYVNAEISITDVDGSLLSDNCTFKVHGNTSAFDVLPKKAFTFKFEKKKDVLGMGKGKKWYLLANIYDPSLLRNYLAIDLAKELGMDYTSEQRFVELWLDGSYRGCYTLYEPVQEGKDRVDIDIDTNDGKKDFLIEYEQMANEEDKKYFTVDGWRFAVKEPDDTTDEQLEYVSGVMEDIVNTMKSGKREDVETVIDIPSFAKFYLVNEFMKNMDFDMSSVYYYYKDGKLYAGPVWDFDKSSGNTDPTIGSQRALNSYKTDGIIQSQRTLYKYIGRQSWFIDEVKRVYEEHYDYIGSIGKDGGILDGFLAEYRELFDRNFTQWNVVAKYSNYQFKPFATYDENYQYFKDWCSERNSWLFDQWDLFGYEYLKGDADGSGVVDIIDATAVQRALVDLNVPGDDGLLELRAAVTEDELSIIDATVIQRYLASLGNPYELDTPVKTRLREK